MKVRFNAMSYDFCSKCLMMYVIDIIGCTTWTTSHTNQSQANISRNKKCRCLYVLDDNFTIRKYFLIQIETKTSLKYIIKTISILIRKNSKRQFSNFWVKKKTFSDYQEHSKVTLKRDLSWRFHEQSIIDRQREKEFDKHNVMGFLLIQWNFESLITRL